ncbi:hypothetical protein EMCRGX_G032085 [Ephydatia muelleri]
MELEAPAMSPRIPNPAGVSEQPSGLTQSSANYTIPGILNFVKHEWTRFERERTNWEVEKSELQAKVAFLQGERKGHENLMRDLIRRIKMLEYALKQERAKLYKFQHGKDLVFSELKPPGLEAENTDNATDATIANQKEESRKVLREYLREVGFPDNVLEARIARINILKSLSAQAQQERQLSQQEAAVAVASATQAPAQPHLDAMMLHSPMGSLPPSGATRSAQVSTPVSKGPIANGADTQVQRSSASVKKESSPTKLLDHSASPSPDAGASQEKASSEGMTVEDNALSSFDFLNEEDSDDDEEEEEEEEGGDEWEPSSHDKQKDNGMEAEALSDSSSGVEGDLSTESAMDEFSSSMYTESSGAESAPDLLEETVLADKEDNWKGEYSREIGKYKPKKKRITARPSRSELERMQQFKNEAEEQSSPSHSSPGQALGGGGGSLNSLGMMPLSMRTKVAGNSAGLNALGSSKPALTSEQHGGELGELAGLTVINEATLIGTEGPVTEAAKKWENRYSMRSHFDAVTCVAFHPTDYVLVTGSEDCTLKVWNFQKVAQAKKSMIVDVEPTHTLRGHTQGVLSIAMSSTGDICFSGSLDSTICAWQLPSENVDPFDAYNPDLYHAVLKGHSDAVWDLAIHPTSERLLSCAADGTCCLWDHQSSNPLLKVYAAEIGMGNPTSIDFVATDLHQMVAAYTTAKTIVYDLETAKPVVNLDSGVTYDGTPNTQINKVICHPTLPIVITGHEDKYIRFFDVNTGKVIHSMTAHMDAVTGLAIDPHGLCLLSGSHDGSLRFWNTESKICVQEIMAHRKRFDESIFNVASHLSKPFFASAGADSIAKVFA